MLGSGKYYGGKNAEQGKGTRVPGRAHGEDTRPSLGGCARVSRAEGTARTKA